jgi:hypothetical protein
MINGASHDSILSLVAGRPECLNTVLDKAVANIDCKSVILRRQLRISIMVNRWSGTVTCDLSPTFHPTTLPNLLCGKAKAASMKPSSDHYALTLGDSYG